MSNSLILKARMFRRRHKLILSVSVICTLIIFIVGMAGRHTSDGEYDSYQLSSGSLINAPPSINAPPDKGGLDKSVLSSIFSFLHLSGAGGASGKKTVPFARTGAAVQSEFNNILKASSQGQLQNQLTRMSDETKLRLIIESQKKFDSDLSLLKKGHLYYDKIFDILMNGGKPPVKSLAGKYKTSERISHARYQYAPEPGSEDERVFSEDYLSQFLELKPDELKQMTIAHKYVVDHLNNLPTPDGLYKGDGIVFVGGGKFNWLTLLSIKSIRSVGSELPIEVLIPKLDEFEPDLCARVFPALNARCIYLPHVLSGTASTINKIQFDGYQYKALAILLSSFENVLLLDSDNIPVHPPDHLFKSEPFPLKGLIVWPDFWRRATSPDYFRLAGMNIDPKVLTPKYNEITGEYETELKPTTAKGDDIPLHQRLGAIPDPTSESGQLMISKKTHMKALILALYYNMYGPSHFYPLFLQGSDGEGDKETFLAATCALKQPFYQVSKFLNAFGHFDTNQNFVGTGMGQYDPTEDYAVSQKKKSIKEKTSNPEERKELFAQDELVSNGPQILFVHANFPKLNPWLLRTEGKIFNADGHRIRLYGTGMKKRTGYDFETVQWSNMKFLLCELQIDLKTYENVDREDLCQEINQHLAFLKSTINTLE